MAFLCCVEVGKVKFNERFYTPKKKWDNESDISPLIWERCGLLIFFFIRLRSKLSFVYCNTEIKLETALKKWINTIIQQSEYAKEKNTRQLRVRAGMQKNKKQIIFV